MQGADDSRGSSTPGDGSGAEFDDASETAAAFARALIEGDAVAAAAYFARTARLLTPDGTELAGRAAIVALLEQLTLADQQLEIRAGRTLLADRVALCTQFWRRGPCASRSARFEATSTARLVLEREDGIWQIAIAAPWG